LDDLKCEQDVVANGDDTLLRYLVDVQTPHWSKLRQLQGFPIRVARNIPLGGQNGTNGAETEEQIQEEDTQYGRSRKGLAIKPKRKKGKKGVTKTPEYVPQHLVDSNRGLLQNVYIVEQPVPNKFPRYFFQQPSGCGCWICDGKFPKNCYVKRRREARNRMNEVCLKANGKIVVK